MLHRAKLLLKSQSLLCQTPVTLIQEENQARGGSSSLPQPKRSYCSPATETGIIGVSITDRGSAPGGIHTHKLTHSLQDTS